MLKSRRKMTVVLCFVNGEPHLYHKTNKQYSVLNITPPEAVEYIKQNLIITPSRPQTKAIFNLLATNFDGCDGYSYFYNKIDKKPHLNSFENIFLKQIKKFLDEFYPPEIIEEFNKKRREAEDIKRKKSETYEHAKRRKTKYMQNNKRRG